MTDPKRWAESGSEADPVLRSVMRYARSQEPSPEQVRDLVRGTLAATGRTTSLLSLRRMRRAKSMLVALAALVAGGASWAAYRVYGEEPSRPLPPVAAPSVPVTVPSASVVRRRTVVAQPESQAIPSAAFAPETPKAPSSRPPRRAREPEDELAVLEEARRLLPNNPAAALALTRDHALRHPAGAFAEEREALAIEALRRLNRIEEASARLRDFEARYPRSPYRRRLGIGQ